SSSTSSLLVHPARLFYTAHTLLPPRQIASLPPTPALSAKADSATSSHAVGSCCVEFLPDKRSCAPKCASPSAPLRSESRDPSPRRVAPGHNWIQSCPRNFATWFDPMYFHP